MAPLTPYFFLKRISYNLCPASPVEQLPLQ